MSMWVFSGYSGFHPQSKDMRVRLVGDSELVVVCEHEREDLSVSLC